MTNRSVEYTRGGRCSVHHLIQVPEGYPECPDHAIWLGVFQGTWYDIGKQFGEASAVRTYVTPLFDFWFSWTMENYENEGEFVEILYAMEKDVALYNPDFVEAMKGVTDGAAPALARSRHANAITDYEKVLLLQFYSNVILRRLHFEDHDCTQIAFLPEATAIGKVIVGRNSQVGYRMGNYGIAYAAVPPAPAHRYVTNTYAGVLFGLGIASDASLYVGRSACAGKDKRVGLDSTFLMAEAAIFGNSVEEAAELIVHGPKEYRTKTGRKTTHRGTASNYILADAKNVAVVEATAHYWAKRHPGDHGERGFIVTANHQRCEYSYDENDVRTDVPMYDPSRGGGVFAGCREEMASKFMDKEFSGYEPGELLIPDPEVGVGGGTGTCTRYLALHWAAMYNFGRVDVSMLQGREFLASRHWYDLNGKKVEYQKDPKTGEWMSVDFLYDHATVEGQTGGWPQTYPNEVPGSSIFVPADKTYYWNLYKPSMWEGPWDKVTFMP